MKYLLLALLIFLIFWYYKKRRRHSRAKEKSLEVEMISCPRCGLYFPKGEGLPLREGEGPIIFCSESCLREHILSREDRK